MKKTQTLESFKQNEITNPKVIFGGNLDPDPEIRKKNKRPGQNNEDDSQNN